MHQTQAGGGFTFKPHSYTTVHIVYTLIVYTV